MAPLLAESESTAAVAAAREQREALKAADDGLTNALHALGPLHSHYRPQPFGLDLHASVNRPILIAEAKVRDAQRAIHRELKRHETKGGRPRADAAVALAFHILAILARVGDVPHRQRGRVVRLCLEELGYAGSVEWALKRAKTRLAGMQVSST